MELYVGAFNKKEIQKITKALQLLKIIHITENISSQSISLIERYSKSIGLQLPDAILAATSIEYDMPLFTFNTKNFKSLTGLKLIKL